MPSPRGLEQSYLATLLQASTLKSLAMGLADWRFKCKSDFVPSLLKTPQCLIVEGQRTSPLLWRLREHTGYPLQFSAWVTIPTSSPLTLGNFLLLGVM